MIKKNLLHPMLAIIPTFDYVQEKHDINWNKIEEVVNTHPNGVKRLVARIIKFNTILTMNERVLALSRSDIYISQKREILTT